MKKYELRASIFGLMGAFLAIFGFIQEGLSSEVCFGMIILLFCLHLLNSGELEELNKKIKEYEK